MTPNLNTPYTASISHSLLSSHRLSPANRGQSPARRTSPVLTAQELRQLVQQMVD